MHMTLQPGGRSPKQVNGPTSTSQLKHGSDSGQNNGTSRPTQTKGKRRERSDHGGDPVKRERSSSRSDGGDSVQCRTETNLKNEIALVTEGGVVDLEAVEKLVQLMQRDRTMDLVSRSMLASAIASTDKVDCLDWFVQLRGLPILDEWLQDIHKGKIGDGNSLKAGDKSAEEFLLVLLHALDKLPVNLQGLQMCNIGRSVNHLRAHKNVEIQRKARTLVDTWKKRVEAEIDAKSGSAVSEWPSKARLPEASHGGSRTPSGSDVALTISQNSAAKTASVRSSHGESSTKYAISSPGPVKPATPIAAGKESQPGTSVRGTADAPQVREDRSSSSNQSHNYGRSSLAKEDVKSSTSGLLTANNASSISTRNRKNSEVSGLSTTGYQKETSSSKFFSAPKNYSVQKLSESALTSERAVEVPIIEGSSPKLIVKIANRVRSPAQGASGGSLEDPTLTSSRASSPVLLNKHEQSDNVLKDQSDTYRCNGALDMKEWQNNDKKDVLTWLEGADSPAFLPDEEQSMTSEDFKKMENQLKSGKLRASSFCPMNALVESCVKYSEATSSLSLEDDVGMNLLASVAAEEMSRSDAVSPTDSTQRSVHAVEAVCTVDEAKSKSASEDRVATVQDLLYNEPECGGKQQADLNGSSWAGIGFNMSKHAPISFLDGRICATSHPSVDMAAGEGVKGLDSSSTDSRRNADCKLEASEKPNEKADISSSASPVPVEVVRTFEVNEGSDEGKATSNDVADSFSNCGSDGTDLMVAEEKECTDHLRTDECKPIADVAGSKPSVEGDYNKFVNDGLDKTIISEKKVAAETVKTEFAETSNYGKLHQAESGRKSVPESGDAVKVGVCDDANSNSGVRKRGRSNFVEKVGRNSAGESHLHVEDNIENQETPKHASLPESRFSCMADRKAQKEPELTGSSSAGAGPTSSSAAGPKLEFDLNEDFSVDDGRYKEIFPSISVSPTTVHAVNSLPFSTKSIPSSHSASVTIASAAKGPFVPPEDLLIGKVELGWKGSAATSAFRPAEPRKVVETLLGPTRLFSSDVSTSKHDRILLDIDLNVPDKRVLEEIASRGLTDSVINCATLLNEASESVCVRGGGRLDLDLNRVDEAHDTGRCSTSVNYNGEASALRGKPLGGLDVRRDFDLNNGPVVDDANVEQFPFVNQIVKGGTTPQFPSSGLRMNSPLMGSFSSWFPSGNTYSVPDRGEQPFSAFPHGAPQRTFGPAGLAPYNPDVFRGSVLSSSPAVAYPASPFQLPVFPIGPTFPLPSATFSVGASSYVDSSSVARPPVNSQYLWPVGSVTSQLQRPYTVGLPDIGNNSGLDSNRQWSRQGLDLNTGPGAMESELREEMVPLSSGQHSVGSLQGLAEEQARMFSVSGGFLKRKEPDGGWDSETFRQKQSSRQ